MPFIHPVHSCLISLNSFAQKDSVVPVLPITDTAEIIYKSSQQPEQKDIVDLVKQAFRIKSNPYKDSIRNTKDISIAVLPAAADFQLMG